MIWSCRLSARVHQVHTGVALIVPSNAGVHLALQITNTILDLLFYFYSVLEPSQACVVPTHSRPYVLSRFRT